MTVPVPAIPEDEGPPLPDPTTAPAPSGKFAGWYPALVDIPGLTRIQRARAYATPEGLYVWRKAPREGADPHPDLWVPVRWDLTGPMPRDAQARVQGVYLATEYGIVHITPTGGCGCGSRLRHWSPPWASTSLTGWPGTALSTTEVPQGELTSTEPDDGPEDSLADSTGGDVEDGSAP